MTHIKKKHQYEDEIKELNFRMFKSVSFYLMVTSLFLGFVTFIPNPVLSELDFRILLFLSTFIGALLYLPCIFVPSVIKRFATLCIYLVMSFLQVFFLLLENIIVLHRGSYTPYSLPLVFMLLQPIIIVDENVRKNIFTACTMVVLIVISAWLKPLNTAINDIFNIIPLGLSGCAIGIISRTYVVNYLDRKVAEKNLDLEKAKAESKAKSEFLAFVNHEIRSPMNTIVGLNEMILRESKDNVALGYSKEIKQACGTLSLLINDVLDFSKINSNDFSLVPVEYNLDALLNDLLTIVVPRAQEKNLEFAVSIKEDTPNNLIGDDMRIKQCVMNLLSNAIKYTDKGSVKLLVSWKQSADDDHCILLTFAVEDTGCGIKPSDIDRIASPFERLDELKNRNIEGSGLGLSIVKGLLKKMGSSLCVTSEYGIGSNFSFTIRQPVELNVPIGKYTAQTYTKKRKGASLYGTFLAPTARILVVDDLKMNRDIICALLKCTQINIDTASSGNEAIELVKNNHYDVVLLDHRMPGMDGIETLRAIKALDIDFADDTKFIALTANASHGYKALYMQKGFDDYLPKPIDSEGLEQMLVRMLPKNLIRIKSASKYQEYDKVNDGDMSGADNSRFIAMYSGIEGVDCNAAMSLCKNVSVLLEAVRTFYNDSEAKIADLQQDFNQCNLKSYIIAVHSLKTELRVIGFDSLSKQASLLEFFSDNGDIESVREYTPDFLVNLQHFRDKIRGIIEKTKAITTEDYQDLLKSLKECSQVQDLKAAERMLHMVDGFAMPEGEESFFTLLRQSVRNGNSVLFKRLMDSH